MDKLYSIVCEVEDSVFTRKVIKRAFSNTRLFPFDTKRITNLPRQNLKAMKKEEDLKQIDVMKKAVKHVMSDAGVGNKVRKAPSLDTTNALYST